MQAGQDERPAALYGDAAAHIAGFGAKATPKPLPKTAITRGFEKFAYPKREWPGMLPGGDHHPPPSLPRAPAPGG